MDFEQKYSRFRASREPMPEGYLEELQQKVQHKKDLKKLSLKPYIIGSGIAAMLIAGLFMIGPAGEPEHKVALTDTLSSEVAGQYVSTLMDNDNLLARNSAEVRTIALSSPPDSELQMSPGLKELTAPADIFADSSFSEEELFEYLLEEGFEEI